MGEVLLHLGPLDEEEASCRTAEAGPGLRGEEERSRQAAPVLPLSSLASATDRRSPKLTFSQLISLQLRCNLEHSCRKDSPC